MKAPTHLKLAGSAKTETCPEHGEYRAEIIGQGFKRPIYSRCPDCDKDRDAALAKEQERENLKAISDRRAKCGIPIRFQSSTVKGYQPPCQKATTAKNIVAEYTRKFETLKNSGASLVFCGKPGTGKTHLACAIGNEVIKAHSVKYINVYDLMNRIKDTFRRESDERLISVIWDYTSCDLLIIDEIGVQYGTETEKLAFYKIINKRYEDVKPTILISNLTESELTEFVGERCIDRMRDGGGAVIAFDWESYRG